MNTSNQSDENAQPAKKPARRVRYSGTHPKRYKDKYKEHNITAHPDIEARLRAKGKTPASTHVPIMTEEVLACLNPKPGEIVIDCTLGYGGHASEFIKRIGPTGKLIALDVDSTELERTRERLGKFDTPISFHRSNFAGIGNVLGKEKLDHPKRFAFHLRPAARSYKELCLWHGGQAERVRPPSEVWKEGKRCFR